MYIRQSYQALYSKGIEIISQDISVQSERLEYSKPTELTFHCTETKGKAYFRKERVCILSSSEEKMKARTRKSSVYKLAISDDLNFSNLFLFIYFDCARSSLCSGFSLVVAVGGYSLVAVLRLLTAVASLIAQHRLWSSQASVVVAPRL